MAVVWQNTFDGPVGNNLTPINSANYGDPILDNQRNGNPADAVRYGNRAYMGNSSMQLGLQDGSGHGDTWVYSPSVNAYSLSFYLYLADGGWFRFRDANNVSELYFATASQSVVVNDLFNQESEMFDRWVRVEFIVSSSELGCRIWWNDPDSTGTPDYEYIIARAGGTVGDLLCQGGAGANVYVDQVQIGEGEWIGPWPNEDRTTTATGAAVVSGLAVSSRMSLSSGNEGIEVTSTATAGSSTRSTTAHTDVEVTGDARGYEGVPPVDAHGSAAVEGSAQASTQRNSSASLSVDADADVVSTRESVRSAHTGVEVSAEAEETKTAQTGLADDFRMTGLIGSDREESLVFPIQLHVEIDVPGNSWVDITADVRATEKVVISRGRANEAAHPDASTMTLKLNNRHGRYSPRNPRSPYFGRLGRNTPIRVYVTQGDITMYRFIGEVSEWPPRWDISDTDVWVNLEAAGILRRLEQNDLEYTSAYRRFVERSEPIVYWSLTNGKETGLYAPADVGRGDFKFTARLPNYAAYIVMPAWQDAELSPWMEPIVRTVGERGIAEGIVMDGSSASWCLDWVRTGPGGMDALYVTMQRGDEDVLTYYVGEEPTEIPRTIFVSRQFNQNTPAPLGEVAMGGLAADEPHHMRLTVVQEGGNTTTTLYGDGRVLISDTRSGTFTGSVSSIFYEWNVLGESGSSAMYHVGLGHISLWNYGDEPLLENSMAALRGHAGEVSGRRIERLCREEGVDLDVIGNLDDTGRVGPQRLAPFLTLVRQSAEVDGGILMESRVRNALLYRTNRSRYNQKEG